MRKENMIATVAGDAHGLPPYARRKYDFSTAEKVDAFVKAIDKHWEEPLPNLKWISESEFARDASGLYRPRAIFTRRFGGPNKGDNLKQLPKGWTEDPKHAVYASCFLYHYMNGIVILRERRHWDEAKGKKPQWVDEENTAGKVWYGTFAFCEHQNVTTTNLGRCYNRYTCKACGFSWEIDSSD